MMTAAQILAAAEIVKVLGKLAIVGTDAIRGALQAIFGGGKTPQEIEQMVRWLATDATFREAMAKRDAGVI